MKYFFIALMMSLSVAAFAHGQGTEDLEATMKEMGLAYKKAIKAENIGDFDVALARFSELLEKSQHGGFKNHQEKSQEGLKKVMKQVKMAQQLAHKEGLEKGKQPLKQIDALRKEYHKLHKPPGFWELLFGD